jgi:DNA-binding transcriptional MerR regulator
MRMRELESKTGVGRETIRFYIREGLLPEPDRVSRNSAFYSDDHVTRVRAIKRLQEERFLPLGVIKTLLDAEDGDRWLHAGAFPEIDSLLRLRLDGTAPRLSRDEVIAQTGCQPDQFDEAVALGTVTVDASGCMSQRDAAILSCHARLDKVGFTRERGFAGENMTFFAELIDWLVSQELRLFFDNTAGEIDELQALDMAESGISAINDMLGHLHTREILRRLEARRRIANDNQ